jgi:hypothetical protein
VTVQPVITLPKPFISKEPFVKRLRSAPCTNDAFACTGAAVSDVAAPTTSKPLRTFRREYKVWKTTTHIVGVNQTAE